MPNQNFLLPKCPSHGRAIKHDRCAACNVAYMREYTDLHANDLSWRGDHRRAPINTQFDAIIGSAGAHPPSRRMTDYWQRRKAA